MRIVCVPPSNIGSSLLFFLSSSCMGFTRSLLLKVNLVLNYLVRSTLAVVKLYKGAWTYLSSCMLDLAYVVRYTLTENGEALAERLEVVETGRPLGGGSGANSNSCGSSGTVMSPPLPNFSSAGSSLTSLNSLPGALTSPITKRKESTPKQSTSPTLSPREMAAQAAIRRNQAVQSGSRAADLEQWKEFPACAATNRSASSNQMKSRLVYFQSHI